MTGTNHRRDPRIVIVGAGMSGTETRAKLTPGYQPFCTRQVLSGDYLRRITKRYILT